MRHQKFLAAAALAVTASIAVGAGSKPAPATAIESVHASHVGERTTVTLSGNGLLTPANISEAPDKPRRLMLDFADVNGRAAMQDIVSPLVRHVRVGLNSRAPLVTRVIIEIDDRATYHVERSAASGRDLAVVFEPGVSPTRVLLTPAAGETVPAE